ncbi:MAG: type I DNA topoisomerase [Cyanobacteria bacterium SZAS LIN-2]|nr:type I DNA topoisomerase [Cyanobacteria bacterium SZAS LIN-3]MBS1996808.1 type I DNA topoisomerase [Cyanobacteria bacterium SZAS LIN-2]MBS2007438.1 type I DNA topoisomerase [Cyanobacteria bacterium SZAS TMP-1]
MPKFLVIVESPAKAKTISKILGKDYTVKASVGHVRDLPKNKLGVNVRKNFEPLYELLKDKEPIVAELKEAASTADKVFLAPDPDREGEAIAWHLSEILDLPKKKVHRIEFNEITKDAVLAAIKAPRQIDKRLVDAQQARRVLDRLVGYKISPLLWRKVNGRSAGRVQSVAVRLICARETEVDSFTPQEYWTIKAELSRAKSKTFFSAPLSKWQGKRVIAASEKATAQTTVIDSKKLADEILKKTEKQEFAVASVTEKVSQRSPQAPFITSTLQREASTFLGYTVKKTMQVAQTLYEGVELPEGATGLITYMRTDSTRVSQQAQDDAKKFIISAYGKKYYPDKPRVYARKGKSVQDAHEAIRPAYPERKPESLKQYLTPDQLKVYKLIWERFMASQMASAEILTRSVEITAGDAVFRASASEKKFAGFTIVYDRLTKDMATDSESQPEGEEESEEATNLPELTKGEKLKLKDFKPDQHFTQPPPRYTEASLIKTLEELGIGRPSTYAATVNTIVDRKYVERQQKALCPTKLGQAVNALLVEHFGNIVDVGFTAEMEADLDKIEEDKVDWHLMLKGFYQPFNETLKKAEENMNKVLILSDQLCPACGQPMAIRSSRFGQFLGCVGYPECKTKIALTKEGKPVPEDRPSEELCKTCKSPMLIRYGRYGDYLACSSEECTEQRPILKLTGVDCPRPGCEGHIVEKKSRHGKIFYGCSNYSLNQCTSAYWYPPIVSGGPNNSNKCPQCGTMLVYKLLKRGDQVACAAKECDFAQPITGKETYAGQKKDTPTEVTV